MEVAPLQDMLGLVVVPLPGDEDPNLESGRWTEHHEALGNLDEWSFSFYRWIQTISGVGHCAWMCMVYIYIYMLPDFPCCSKRNSFFVVATGISAGEAFAATLHSRSQSIEGASGFKWQKPNRLNCKYGLRVKCEGQLDQIISLPKDSSLSALLSHVGLGFSSWFCFWTDGLAVSLARWMGKCWKRP